MTMAWSWVRVSCLVLLFSGCLAAVVNKETPEAPVVTKIDLTEFIWSDDGSGDGTYLHLEVCSAVKVEDIAGPLYTLAYYNNKDGSVLKNFEGGTLGPTNDTVCVKFGDTEEITLPDGEEIIYELHIASEDELQQQSGSATFTINLGDYKTSDVVACGGTDYDRSVGGTAANCTGYFIKGEKICYTQTQDGGGGPDTDGCIENTEEIKVCLSDKKGSGPNTPEGTIVVNSLTYPGINAATDASLDIVYTAGLTNVTTIEFLMQDSDNLTLFYAGACTDPVNGGSCPTADYDQQVKTYKVCGVGVGADGAVVSYTPEAGIITDLNLAGYPDTETDRIEFGFNNVRVDADRYYFASVVDAADRKKAKTVGIDCQGVTTGHTCYGFLDISDLSDDVQLTVEYGNGTTTPGDVTSNDENKIIGTYTKITP